MLRQTVIVAALSLAAASALAATTVPRASAVYPGGETAWEPSYEPSGLTRAQVIAELQRSQGAGEIVGNYETEPNFAGLFRLIGGEESAQPTLMSASAVTFDDSIYLPNG